MNPVLAWFETLALVLPVLLLLPVTEVLIAYSLERNSIRLRTERRPLLCLLRCTRVHPGGRPQKWPDGRCQE